MKNVDELSRSRSISPAFTPWAWTHGTLQFIISRLNLAQQGKPEPPTWTSIRRTNLFLALGLAVMAALCFEGRLALAQADAPCPLPAGVRVPTDPPVTAQDVVDGSATLEQFTLAARNQFTGTGSEKPTPAQIAYTGCRLRQDGGPWRSGDIYLVTLTPDGRVYLHAKRMSLSAGKLKPAIYAGILVALGTPQAILEGLSSTDAAVRSDAQNRLTTYLESDRDAAFSLRGGISGHAASYVSVNARRPFVMLTGFDLNASHLADEVIDYGSPAITAREVVDRATLKQFVGEALKFIAETVRNAPTTAASRVAFQKARLALRDPNGPWRHGSVYIHIVDGDSNLILFHGGFPDQLELRRGGINRDAVTGELIFAQLVRAARSSPEGGFWEYHFDNPADDSDSTDIPKVGYARQFVRTTTALDGTEFRTNLIIASGFYLTPSKEEAPRQNNTVKVLLPQVMRAMTASTVDAVSGRIQQASSGIAPDNHFSLGGASTLSGVLLANGQALEDGTFELDRLLADSSFTLAVSGHDRGSERLFGNLTLWGSGDYRSLSGGDPQNLEYDGNVTSAHLGIDTWLSANVLAGFSVAQARGMLNYKDTYELSGEFTTTLTSIHPYVGWQRRGTNLWATVGFGSGEVKINDKSDGAQASDLTQRMIAAGISWSLVTSDHYFEGGTTNLRLKAETAFTWADVEGAGTLESMRLSTNRQRVMLEGSYVLELASGATLAPLLEFGLRQDGGDGETGSGLETGGALRYVDLASGLTIEGRTRILFAHSGDYEEWGLSGLVQYDPGEANRGLMVSVKPAWGQTESGVQRLWESASASAALPVDPGMGRMHAEVGYGLNAKPGFGVVTPFAGLELADEGSQLGRMGARWQVAPGTDLNLEGTRREAAYDDEAVHSVMMTAALRW